MNRNAAPLCSLYLLAMTTAPCAQESAPEIADSVAAIIDAIAGHPDDPQLPAAELGASDEVLSATDSLEIAELLRSATTFARAHPDRPRFAFALGRAAVVHGYEKLGEDLLRLAMGKGSAAAVAHLGYLAEARGERQAAKELLARAIRAGFTSRRAIETYQELINKLIRLEDFNRADWILALRDGKDLAPLQRLEGLAYIVKIHEVLASDSILFLVDDPTILLEVDPQLGIHAARRIATSPELIQQVTDRSAGALFGGLQALAGARKSGKTINEEVGAMNKAMADRTDPHAIVLAQAEQDGRRLALLYQTDKDTFRAIYHNMCRVIHPQYTGSSRWMRREMDQAPLREMSARAETAARDAARTVEHLQTLDGVRALYEARAALAGSSSSRALLYRTGGPTGADTIHVANVDASGKFVIQRFSYSAASDLFRRLTLFTPEVIERNKQQAASDEARADVVRAAKNANDTAAKTFLHQHPAVALAGGQDHESVADVLRLARDARPIEELAAEAASAGGKK